MNTSNELKQKVLSIVTEHPEGINTRDIAEIIGIKPVSLRSTVYKLVNNGFLCAHVYMGNTCYRGGNNNTLYVTLAENGDNGVFLNRKIKWAVVDRIVDPRHSKVDLFDVCKQNRSLRVSVNLERRLRVMEDVKSNPGITEAQILSKYGEDSIYTIKQLVHIREIFFYKGGYYTENQREAKA